MNPKIKTWLAFFLGLGSLTQIRIIGAMGIIEAFCIALGPFVFISIWPKMRETRAKTIIVFLFLWFLSAGVTDLYRETRLIDGLKGVFVIPTLFFVFVVFFALLWDDLMRIRWIALGILLSSIISIYYFRAQSLIAAAEYRGTTIEEITSFRTVYFTTAFSAIGTFLAFFSHRWPRLAVLMLLVASCGFLFGGSRNGFLTLFLTASGFWLAKGKVISLRSVQRNIVILAVITGIVGVIAVEVYAYSAERGWLGEAAFEKYKHQSESEIGLLSGRAEFIAAILAIKDSPFLGHGSWSVDANYYGVRMLEYLGNYRAARIRSSIAQRTDVWLPTHSHLWQAWVWHGVLGGLFWMVILLLMIRFFKYAIHLCRPLIAYNLFLFIAATWDLLFSPFSNRSRWGILFSIIALGLAEVEKRLRRQQIDSTLDIDAPWDGRWSV